MTNVHINRNWLQEDSLAVLPRLSVGRPGLQGHPFRVQAFWAKQFSDVRRHHDVHAALGAHALPSHTEIWLWQLLHIDQCNTNNPSSVTPLCSLCTYRWGPGCWTSAPCVCEAAWNGLLSRTSPGWPSRSSLCEGSPQSSVPVHPNPSFWLLFSSLTCQPAVSQPQTHTGLFAVGHTADFWTHGDPALWHTHSAGWTCSSWSQQDVSLSLIQNCGTPPRSCRAHYFSPRILDCGLFLWWTDCRSWFIDVEIRVQEKHNRSQMLAWSNTRIHTDK